MAVPCQGYLYSHASDIDDPNIHSSKETVDANGLQSRIRIVKTDPTDGLIPLQTKLGADRSVNQPPRPRAY